MTFTKEDTNIVKGIAILAMIRYMRAGKADALIVTNLDAISDGIADSYLKIGAVREAGYRLFSVDEKEPKVDLYIPPKRGDLQ